MKNKVVLGIAVALILVLGGYGAYKVAKRSQNVAPASQSETAQPPSATKSLRDLLGLGTSEKCTFDQGVVYVASGNVRGDFNSISNGKTISTHMIVKGKVSYIWTDNEKTGFKTTFDTSAQAGSGTSSPEAGASGTAGTSGGIDVNKPADYKCEAWTADNSLFELPKGVVFQDFSSIVPSAVPKSSIPGY